MQIENIDGGFVQYFDNKFIEKIVWLGESIKVETYTILNAQNTPVEVGKHKFYGNCTVHFHDKPPKEMSSSDIDFSPAYNSQYGIPVSIDGSKLFVGSWEKNVGALKKGLQAYDIESGSLIWRLNEGKIRHIFVYQEYLITLKANTAILKVDINNGEVLEQVKSGTIENAYDLGFPYILVDTVKGNLCVLDVETMKTVKNYGSKYNSKLINPSNSFSILIQDVCLRGNVLTISGIEDETGKLKSKYTIAEVLEAHKPFNRVIDNNFGV